MINLPMDDWQRLQDLPALLKELPALAAELGFPFYSFTYTSHTYQINATNLAREGQQLVQAALDSRPAHCRYSNVPMLWNEVAFPGAPVLWTRAHALGLRHGWIQPVHDGTSHSSLTLLRHHVSASITERYEKTAWVMWLAERLHLAATRETLLFTCDHGLCAPSRKVQDPAVDSRSNASCKQGTKRP